MPDFREFNFTGGKIKTFPTFLVLKKTKVIRNTHRHPTCLELNEEGNSTEYMQSNIDNFETVRND